MSAFVFFSVFTQYQKIISRWWHQYIPLLPIACQQQKVEACLKMCYFFYTAQLLLINLYCVVTGNVCRFDVSVLLSLTFPSCSQKLLRSPRKPTRKISKIPFKVLDAPELQDDFYLNLVDWSSLNVLSVGLGTCVYLWSACTSQVLHSVSLPFVAALTKTQSLSQ